MNYCHLYAIVISYDYANPAGAPHVIIASLMKCLRLTAVMIRLHTQDIHLPNLQNTIQYGPIIPNHILMFINTCKGCKPMYNLLLDKKREICTSISKWRDKGYNYLQTSWNKIFELPFKSTQESKLQWLQYQILHRIVPTNKYFFNIKKPQSAVCTFSKTDEESINICIINTI